MKLSQLKPVIYSYTGNVQLCIIYDSDADIDLEHGCSAEYAIKHYGDREVKRISSVFEDGQSYLVISLI